MIFQRYCGLWRLLSIHEAYSIGRRKFRWFVEERWYIDAQKKIHILNNFV